MRMRVLTYAGSRDVSDPRGRGREHRRGRGGGSLTSRLQYQPPLDGRQRTPADPLGACATARPQPPHRSAFPPNSTTARKARSGWSNQVLEPRAQVDEPALALRPPLRPLSSHFRQCRPRERDVRTDAARHGTPIRRCRGRSRPPASRTRLRRVLPLRALPTRDRELGNAAR